MSLILRDLCDLFACGRGEEAAGRPPEGTMKRGRGDGDGGDRVGVVGLGRLGLCQALTLERAGYDVLGCDVFPAYVDSINNKTLQSDEPQVVSLLQARRGPAEPASTRPALRPPYVRVQYEAAGNAQPGGRRRPL